MGMREGEFAASREDRLPEAERPEDMVSEIILQALAAHLLHHQAEQHGVGVGVLPAGPGCEVQRPQERVRQKLPGCPRAVRIRVQRLGELRAGAVIVKAALHAGQFADRDLLPVGHARHVFRDRVVQAYQPLVDQLQDGGHGKSLSLAADAHVKAGPHGGAGHLVGYSEGPHIRAPGHPQADNRSGDAGLLHHGADRGVKPGGRTTVQSLAGDPTALCGCGVRPGGAHNRAEPQPRRYHARSPDESPSGHSRRIIHDDLPLTGRPDIQHLISPHKHNPVRDRLRRGLSHELTDPPAFQLDPGRAAGGTGQLRGKSRAIDRDASGKPAALAAPCRSHPSPSEASMTSS